MSDQSKDQQYAVPGDWSPPPPVPKRPSDELLSGHLAEDLAKNIKTLHQVPTDRSAVSLMCSMGYKSEFPVLDREIMEWFEYTLEIPLKKEGDPIKSQMSDGFLLLQIMSSVFGVTFKEINAKHYKKVADKNLKIAKRTKFYPCKEATNALSKSKIKDRIQLYLTACRNIVGMPTSQLFYNDSFDKWTTTNHKKIIHHFSDLIGACTSKFWKKKLRLSRRKPHVSLNKLKKLNWSFDEDGNYLGDDDKKSRTDSESSDSNAAKPVGNVSGSDRDEENKILSGEHEAKKIKDDGDAENEEKKMTSMKDGDDAGDEQENTATSSDKRRVDDAEQNDMTKESTDESAKDTTVDDPTKKQKVSNNDDDVENIFGDSPIKKKDDVDVENTSGDSAVKKKDDHDEIEDIFGTDKSDDDDDAEQKSTTKEPSAESGKDSTVDDLTKKQDISKESISTTKNNETSNSNSSSSSDGKDKRNLSSRSKKRSCCGIMCGGR
eukprot:g4862.t1